MNGTDNERENEILRIEKENKQLFKPLAKILIASLIVIAFFAGLISALAYDRSYVRAVEKKYENLDVIIDEINKKYYDSVDRDALMEAAIKGLFTELDPYSTAYTIEEYQDIIAQSQGNNKNFGFSVRTLPRRTISVARLTGNSPAESAGLKIGDEIIGISYDGVTYYDSTYLTQAEAFAILSGNSGTLYLKVRRLNATACSDALAALAASNNDAFYDILNDRAKYDYPDPLIMNAGEYNENYVYYYFGEDNKTVDYAGGTLPDGVGYIKLTGFEGKADAQFDAAMTLFKNLNKSKLVLDLRDNPGGNTVVLGNIASYLLYDASKPSLGRIPIFIAKYRDGKQQAYTTSSSKYTLYFGAFEPQNKKITVLVNGMSASASEALSCAIQDYGTGTLIGTTTYKKGIMQTTYSLKLLRGIDYYLKVTVAKYYSPVRTDFSLDGIGLMTDPADANYINDNFYGFEYARTLLSDAQFMSALSILTS